MKKLLTTLLFLMLAFSMFAQEEQQADQAQQDAAMKAWTDFMTPGDEHAMLAKGTGEWKVSQKFWMMPGGEPMETEGSAVGEMIMGGRYLVMNHSGNAMGMPFEGMSIEGYDNAADKFVSVWIDNLGTGVAYSEGHFDEESGLLVYEGSMTDPITKEDVWFKQTTKTVNDNELYFEMFIKAPDGTEFKNMEMTFTKKTM